MPHFHSPITRKSSPQYEVDTSATVTKSGKVNCAARQKRLRLCAERYLVTICPTIYSEPKPKMSTETHRE